MTPGRVTRWVMWSDGTLMSGRTWRAVEDELRDSQKWGKYPDVREFREEMAHRAMVWSGTVLTDADVDGTSYRFLRSLERAGMIRMEVSR